MKNSLQHILQHKQQLMVAFLLSLVWNVVMIAIIVWSFVHTKPEFKIERESIDAVFVDTAQVLESFNKNFNFNNLNFQNSAKSILDGDVSEEDEDQIYEPNSYTLAKNPELALKKKQAEEEAKAKEQEELAKAEKAKEEKVKEEKNKAEELVHKKGKPTNDIRKLIAKQQKQAKQAQLDKLANQLTFGSDSAHAFAGQEGKAGASKANAKIMKTCSKLSGYLKNICQPLLTNFPSNTYFKGQSCEIMIKIAPNGKIIDRRVIKGDEGSFVCGAALEAIAKTAFLPNPPNKKVVEQAFTFSW